MADKATFKKCPMCAATWNSRKQFLNDATLMLNGYQADFDSLAKGLFYFTHKVDQCNSTMAVEAGRFFSLYKGRMYFTRRTGEAECPGYCLQRDILDSCPAECECAFVREIIDIIKKYKGS